MAAARARVPKQVGRYQLVCELGTSHLGPLWAARIEGSDALALLRLVSLSQLDSEARVRLLEAAWQAMEVRDERVLPVTDVVASDGELSVVSEYAEGLPLRAVQSLASVRRKPMTASVALRFILDLVDGVVALHRTMTELGDEAVPLFGGLSADSVLVGADGRAWLLDVAVASAASGLEALRRSPERAAYAAPEQLVEGAPVDARTDVFAVGTLAWEMLANRRLFVGSDKVVAQKVLAAKVPKLEDASRKGEFEVPKRLGAAVLRALALDPAARFESMDAFRAELGAAGLAPAAPAAAATYVATIADGALGRTRDALSLPPRSVAARPSLETRPDTPARRGAEQNVAPAGRPAAPLKPDTPARPTVPTKPDTPARPTVPKPDTPARPTVPAKPDTPTPHRSEPTAPAKARPGGESKAALPATAAVAPKPEARPSVATSARVSIEPKPRDDARVPVSSPPARSVPPAKIRPRQTTMIGLPPPAGLAPEAIPPENRVDEPPPSSDGSEEPTGQYSREHLKQLHAAASSTRPPPPNGPPAPVPSIEPATPSSAVSSADDAQRGSDVPLPRLVSLRPTPRALSELHTERPPPPEPEPVPAPTPQAPPVFTSAAISSAPDGASSNARAPAGLPPPPERLPPMRVAVPPPPASVDARGAIDTTPFAAGAARVRSAPPRSNDDGIPVLGGRAPERPAFSRPPPATAASSYYPSQVAPPLIHDPRANQPPSPASRQSRSFVRGVVLGVVASLSLVALSATVTLSIMGRRSSDASAQEVPASVTRARGDALTRAESAPATTSATTATASAIVTAPHSADSAHAETIPSANTDTRAVAPNVPSVEDHEAAADAPSKATTGPATSHAPNAPRRATKKRPRFVPNDI